MDMREFEIAGAGGIGAAAGGSAGDAGIIDLSAKADKSLRHGMRPLGQVKALVLHQMACCHSRRNPLSDYLKIGAHFAILPDGRILQLHPEAAMIWASNGFNHGSVAVEFAGNFPNTKGQWWQGDKFGRDRVTPAQIEAGRRLIRHLAAKIGLRTVLAHRQSSASRENDPGPDIWRQVGQWAVDTLKLSDGGPGFKIDDGNAIPALWRTWGTATPAKEVKEVNGGEQSEGSEIGENEFESAFGPLSARLTWSKQAHTHAEIAQAGSRFEGFGGVYIAFVPGPPGSGRKFIKVGMADSFARRMRDKEYLALVQKQPGLSFFLARVQGHRGRQGVAGVVRMVELALARLLRRAGVLSGRQLPYLPTQTLGRVQIENVLPPQLRSLLPAALTQTKIDAKPFAPMPPGQLVLPRGVTWEFEHVAPA